MKGKKMVKKRIKSLYKHLYSKYYIKKNEHIFNDKTKYLFIDKTNKNPNTIIIVFSAFTGNVPRYNYFYSFKNLPVSQLFILDNYGLKGSYYWLENGKNNPELLTLSLIENIKRKYGFTNIITAGTSKGGTAAIYFGLEIGAQHIFSGACQFYIGQYLNRPDHLEILKKMIGDNVTEQNVKILDDKLGNQIKKYKDSHGIMHIFYSKKELTYERQTVHLLNALKESKYQYIETVENFVDHSIVGTYFAPFFVEWYLSDYMMHQSSRKEI